MCIGSHFRRRSVPCVGQPKVINTIAKQFKSTCTVRRRQGKAPTHTLKHQSYHLNKIITVGHASYIAKHVRQMHLYLICMY